MDNVKNNFLDELVTKPLGIITSLWIIDNIPFLFNNDKKLYTSWRHTLASALSVDPSAVVMIGSASLGFSLNPHRNYRAFNSKSDIDVAIVSDYYFSEAWRCLRNLGSKRHDLSQSAKQSVIDHREKYIYWGTIATDKILQILPFKTLWQDALTHMATIDPTKNRKINARIYKDFDSLRAYQTNNLINLRDQEIMRGNLDV